MKATTLTLVSLIGLCSPAIAQRTPGMSQPATMQMHHDHSAAVPLSYAELKDTLAFLDRAKQVTTKYQDVRVAESDGYRAIGPDVPGMGIHYVLARKQAGFSVDQPPILLYEKDTSAASGFTLVGVSYLLNAPEGPDGQPLNSPLPKALAAWHRHENICVLPDRSTPPGLNEDQCKAQGGHFTAETQWMVHAWIWKDSPLGVFSPTNPAVH